MEDRAASSALRLVVLVVICALAPIADAEAAKKLFVGGLSWSTDDETHAMKVRPLHDRILVKRTTDTSGGHSAVAWVESGSGAGTLVSLPNPFGTTDSEPSSLDCVDASALCLAGGFVENTSSSRQPLLWECTASACTSWTTTLLPLPAGAGSGQVEGVFIPQSAGLSGASAAGSTVDLVATPKPTAWQPNVTGGWDATVLPDLGTLPTPPKPGESCCFDTVTSSTDIAAGTVADDGGDLKPVVWFYDVGMSSWSLPLELPLLSGGVEGSSSSVAVEDLAVVSRELTVAGVSEIDVLGSGLEHAVLWHCFEAGSDCLLSGSWKVYDLPPASGFDNSLALHTRTISTTHSIVVGSSYPTGADPFTAGVATLWLVDFSLGQLILTIDLNDRTHDVGSGDILHVATSSWQMPSGEETILVNWTGSAAPGDPRSAVLTQTQWNRRVSHLEIERRPGGQSDTYDVDVGWTIDLAGTSTVDVELGASVALDLNGIPQASTDSPDCIIWDITDSCSGYHCEVSPDGDPCGTATINGQAVELTCDGDTGTCSTPVLATHFVTSANPDDTLAGRLTALIGTESEPFTADDVLAVLLGAEYWAVPLLPTPWIVVLGASFLGSGAAFLRRRRRIQGSSRV